MPWRVWLGHWPDFRCLRNFPPGLLNKQVNFLHGSLGFQEWVLQEAGSRIFPLSWGSDLSLALCYFHHILWVSVVQSLLTLWGVGDPVPPPRGRGVKESVAQMECPTVPTAEWQNPTSIVAIFYFYSLHSLPKNVSGLYNSFILPMMFVLIVFTEMPFSD